jgi:NAD-dependent deacetylase
MMYEAGRIAEQADIFLVVGTSLVVYPAAGLLDYVRPSALKYIIDPVKPSVYDSTNNLFFIEEKASVGTPKLVEKLIEEHK